jgi:hypothetical protein
MRMVRASSGRSLTRAQRHPSAREMAHGVPGQSLGEDAAWARRTGAEQPAEAELPRDAVATPREISQRPGVTTVDVRFRGITRRASGFHLYGRDQERDLAVRFVDVPGIKLGRHGLGQ